MTAFGNGTWELIEGEDSLIQLVFGTSRQVCKLLENATFKVIEQYFRRSGQRRHDCVNADDLSARARREPDQTRSQMQR